MKISNLVRTAVERLSRGRVIKRHICVKGVKVPIFVSPDAQLKYLKFWKDSFDADLIWLAETFLEEESNVWDVGANVGIFTFAASAVAHRGAVVSVEADIWLATILRRSAQLEKNKTQDIRILPVAVSEADSTTSFLIAKRGRASNTIEEAGGRSQMGGVRERQYVPTLRLDTISLSCPKPDFIKVDVEGAELMVLRGANEIINHVRPIFYIEVGNDVSDEVLGIFQRNRYLAFDLRTGAIIDRCLPNTLFIPEENKKAQQRLAGGRPNTR